MMVVLLVISVIMGAVFKSINLTQQTSKSQQIRLDVTQQAREFVDQLTTDLRNAGYPNQRNMTKGVSDPNNANTSPNNTFSSAYDPYNSPGLIYVNNGSLWFSGTIDGSTGVLPGTSTLNPGTADVEIIRYDLATTGPNCPCLRRTEFRRNGGDPYTDANTLGTAVQQLEIQGVQNGTSTNPIFTVYDATGTAIALPLQWSSGNTIASVNSLKVVLTVKSTVQDYNHEYPMTTVVSSVALTNCSEAMLNGQTPAWCQ